MHHLGFTFFFSKTLGGGVIYIAGLDSLVKANPAQFMRMMTEMDLKRRKKKQAIYQ